MELEDQLSEREKKQVSYDNPGGLTERCDKKLKFLGATLLEHTEYSGYELARFYQCMTCGSNHQQITFFDPFDNSERVEPLKPCRLDHDEIKKLVKEVKVSDYRRFYWD